LAIKQVGQVIMNVKYMNLTDKTGNTEWSDRRKADKTGNGEYLFPEVQSRRHDKTNMKVIFQFASFISFMNCLL
jgi:hypothetical protein